MALLDMDRSRLAWWALGLGLVGALGFVLYSFVGTFVFGVFIYYATRPIHRRLKRRLRPPSLAAAVSLFALALPALLLMLYALAVGLQQIRPYLNGGEGGTTVAALQPYLNATGTVSGPDELFQTVRESGPDALVSQQTVETLLNSLGQIGDSISFVGIGAIHLFVMLALAFYLLRDDYKLARWVRGRFGDDTGVLEAYLRAVDRDFNNIFFGNILNAVLTGTIGVIAYSLLNTVAPQGVAIPAAALVGLLAGVASLIPVVGMKLVYVPVAAYMGLVAILGGQQEALWFVAVFAGVSFVIVDTIPDLVLRPYVSGRSLHVGAVMIAYTFGPLLFGWYGIFLAPMLLVLVVHFARIVLPELIAGTPIQPYAVDPTHMIEGTEPHADVDGVAADGEGTGDAENSVSDGERGAETGDMEWIDEPTATDTDDAPDR
ncbi:AI-2E family transporter [Salinirubrum litoreum]|uniref:AI-2E family transporter n=1 Tax=Salinirubrum litoreum TaxID=1126234 RepID=A0ABD5R9B6_9EURY|nr:AI-2E family transporter [Salinirubrum litoreum]